MNIETSIGIQIRTLSNLIRRRVNSATEEHRIDRITGMQFWIIGYLYENIEKDIFQKDIETRFEIRRSTATKILQLMEKNGLIERQSVPFDARLKKIILTQMSIKITEGFQQKAMEIENQLTKGLTKEEIESFMAIINKMKKNIE